MAFDNVTDKLMMKNKALYYLTLFVGFFVIIQFDNKIMAFLLGKLGGFIPYNWVNIILGRFIEYTLALYIVPMILAFLILQLIERR